MADAGGDSAQEKTFEPSAERLRKAREEGSVVFSKEVVTAASFLGMLVWFFLVRHAFSAAFGDCVRDFFAFTRFGEIDGGGAQVIFLEALRYSLRIAGPLIGLALVLGVAASMSQTGFQIATKKKLFDFTRLDPVGGFTRAFALTHWFDGLKAALKAALFGYVCYATIRASLDRILIMGAMPPGQALEAAVGLAMLIVFRAGLMMIAFAAADYLFQWWQRRKKLMMSHQEMKEEMKESEGDPIFRRRIRSKQMEMSRRRTMAAVKTADVVVTNPTRYAVALRYDAAKDAAPRLVAKGARLMAQRIKDEAAKHKVPVVEDRFVARSIYFNVKIGQEVPASLFRAVAEILAYVYHLTGRIPRRRSSSRAPLRRPATRATRSPRAATAVS
ncbi:MAG: EscU/YscU/HrcU family type III secretion system export apparatus switch protein [Candidatus Sumerlaeota bacterium]|nr:EscU/YscU/HrcU family type III secretion system export apparatus switch protein [Candidatus Sumerlaeota bacterium]